MKKALIVITLLSLIGFVGWQNRVNLLMIGVPTLLDLANPISEETITLTAEELSMLDLVKGAEMAIAMGMASNTKELSEAMVKGTEWFKENNPKAYKILLN